MIQRVLAARTSAAALTSWPPLYSNSSNNNNHKTKNYYSLLRLFYLFRHRDYLAATRFVKLLVGWWRFVEGAWVPGHRAPTCLSSVLKQWKRFSSGNGVKIIIVSWRPACAKRCCGVSHFYHRRSGPISGGKLLAGVDDSLFLAVVNNLNFNFTGFNVQMSTNHSRFVARSVANLN